LGQKTHPYGLRLGIIKSWKSKWFASNNYADLLQEDLLIRRYTNKRLEHAGIAEIEILRAPKKVTIDILTARPGIVIGRKGAEVDKLKEELQLLTGKEILLNIIEIKKPEFSATLVAQSIAKQLEGRVNFRRAMKKALAAGMKSGAEGMKIVCSGRLGGAEIARSEKYHDGRVPLHTLRADIDYATATAHTTYGTIGVKVWICKGEIIGDQGETVEEAGKSSLGLKEQPADTKRRRARRKRQAEDKPRGSVRSKPSAKELDKSQRRARSKTGRPESAPGQPSERPPKSSEARGKRGKVSPEKSRKKDKESGGPQKEDSSGGKD